MPEGSIFQSWYPPATRAAIEEYLTRISREYRIPVVDARHWMADDYFWDSHHLDRRGATRFTRRFGQEVIPSLVRGKLDAIRPVLVPIPGAYPEEPSEPSPLLEAHAPAGTKRPATSGHSRWKIVDTTHRARKP